MKKLLRSLAFLSASLLIAGCSPTEAPTAPTQPLPAPVAQTAAPAQAQTTLPAEKQSPPAPPAATAAKTAAPQPVASAKVADDHNGATALCRDGTYSYAAHHQGACSWHGGVEEWYR